jgi:hypothetical protein
MLAGMAAILVLLFSPPMNMAGQDQADWTVVASSGRVETTTEFDDPARWEPVVRGMNLNAASRIRTGADSRATLVWEGSIIVVDPDSHLEIPISSAPDQPARFFQESGSAVYSIKKARKHRFQVITPYLVAGVKGTLFRVTVSPDTTSVLVSEGVVAVSALDGWDRLEVRAGERVHLDGLPGSRLRLEELQQEETALNRREFNVEQVKARRVSGTDTPRTGEGNDFEAQQDPPTQPQR